MDGEENDGGDGLDDDHDDHEDEDNDDRRTNVWMYESRNGWMNE